MRKRERAQTPTAALALAAALAIGIAGMQAAWAVEGDPQWNPQASEKLVKLPASYLKRSLDNDFARSELGQAVKDADTEIALKVQTLIDLKGAVEAAEGEIKTDLQHNLLVEKRAYIGLVARKNELRRKHLAQKRRVLEDVLAKMERAEAGMTPARLELIARQDAARQRFDTSFDEVDLKLFESSTAPESKYARDYAKNLGAIEALVQAIEQHPMSQGPEIDGLPVTKPEYVRQLVALTEAEIALLDQEDQIIGYMAKLVALDATALSEDIADPELVDSDIDQMTDVTYAVQFFVQ